MKKMIQRINTLLIVMWMLGSIMWIGGETDGNLASQIFLGGMSLVFAYIFGKELAKRNLLITDEDNDNDKY